MAGDTESPGSAKGGSGADLILEDPNGTIRFVGAKSGQVELMVQRR
jgi:hypothetical protein